MEETARLKGDEENLWVRRPELKHERGTIARIAQQAVDTYHDKGNRTDTFFFKVVLGGNVGAVKKVINHMQKNGDSLAVDWLLKRGHQQKVEVKAKHPILNYIKQSFMFLFISAVCLLLTPFFYSCHLLTTAFCGRQKKRISANIKLPLAFAAFSQKEKMMEYFLSMGVDIENTDGEYNNVFHYIADLSSESSERAIEIFCNLVKFINDPDVTRLLLVRNRNTAGLTAVEYAAKLGSPALLTQMLNHPNLLQKTIFAVGDELVCFDDEQAARDDELEDPNDVAEAPTKLEYVDVSMYEAGTIENQSTLLNMLSDRDVATMTREDLQLFEKMAFVGQWITFKVKQMIVGVVLLQFVDLMVTVLLLMVLANGHISSPFQAKESQAELVVMMKEIESLKDNQSHIFTSDAFAEILQTVRYETQLAFLPDRISSNDEYKEMLWKNALIYYPELGEFFDNNIDNMDFSRNSSPPWVIDRLYDTTMALDEFEEDWPLFYVWRYLPKVIKDYTSRLAKKKPHVFSDKIDISNRELVYDELYGFFMNYSIMVGDYKIRPSKSFSFWDFHRVFCVKKEFFTPEDMKDRISIPPPKDIYHSSCDYKVLLNMANRDCKDVSPSTVYQKIQTFNAEASKVDEVSLVEIFYDVIVVLSCLYMVLDIVERLVFIYTCVANQSSCWQMLLSVLGKKVPGSYARKQINILTYLGFIACFIIMYSDATVAHLLGLTHDQVHELGTYFLIIGLVFRFVMHIHAMRLLPGIGHFVITTFMMGTNLLHFSAVFGIVVLIFSILFHILIDDPACPVEKHEGYRTMMQSIFATFKLTFGHGDFSPYFTSTPASITYTLYVVVVGLLLMNLIIAIMSTTATEIMADPWKEVLWRVEWLDEATSVEYTLSVLGLFMRRCCTMGYFTHRKAGFVVRKLDGVYHVYIEVFHCPALE